MTAFQVRCLALYLFGLGLFIMLFGLLLIGVRDDQRHILAGQKALSADNQMIKELRAQVTQLRQDVLEEDAALMEEAKINVKLREEVEILGAELEKSRGLKI